MPIKTCVFDGDGVVIQSHRFTDCLEREYHIPSSLTLEFFNGAIEACLVGRADLKQTLGPFLARWQWPDTTDAFIERWFSYGSQVDQQVIDTIGMLRQRGIRCCLATNQERYRVDYMQTRMGFARLFDAIFFSGAIGAKKPNPAFFAHVTRVLGQTGPEILFWDDTLSNVEAARSHGWYAEQYRTFADFEQKLQAYLALP